MVKESTYGETGSCTRSRRKSFLLRGTGVNEPTHALPQCQRPTLSRLSMPSFFNAFHVFPQTSTSLEQEFLRPISGGFLGVQPNVARFRDLLILFCYFGRLFFFLLLVVWSFRDRRRWWRNVYAGELKPECGWKIKIPEGQEKGEESRETTEGWSMKKMKIYKQIWKRLQLGYEHKKVENKQDKRTEPTRYMMYKKKKDEKTYVTGVNIDDVYTTHFHTQGAATSGR